MSFKSPNGLLNYGLSHGMGGPLVTLSMAYKNGIRVDGLIETINEIITEYMNTFFYVEDIIYWPGKIKYEQRVGLEEIKKKGSQMSWCYSSIGILRALYLTSDNINNIPLKNFVVSEFIKISKLNNSYYYLSQPIVCHGFAGTAAVFKMMYLDTGNKKFLKKALELTELCTNFSHEIFLHHQAKIAQQIQKPVQCILHEYLEGYSGILQTILFIMKNEPNEDERRLLIV